jgi:hypothetical protein
LSVKTIQRMRYSIRAPAAMAGEVPWIRNRSQGGVIRARFPASEKKAKTSLGEAGMR